MIFIARGVLLQRCLRRSGDHGCPDRSRPASSTARTHPARSPSWNLGEVATVLQSAEQPAAVSAVPPAEILPRRPSWGPRVVHEMPLDAVFQHLAKNELSACPGAPRTATAKPGKNWKPNLKQRLVRHAPRSACAKAGSNRRRFTATGPRKSDGNDLIIYEPGVVRWAPRGTDRFDFPAPDQRRRLCLADYFAPSSSGQMDVVAFQVVTVGQEATQRFDVAGCRRLH